MSMVEKTNEMIDELNELTKEMQAEMFKSVPLKDIDVKEFVLAKKMFKLMDTAIELTKEQAKIIDDQNAKLDEILKLLKK